jgi:hypothetical protein
MSEDRTMTNVTPIKTAVEVKARRIVDLLTAGISAEQAYLQVAPDARYAEFMDLHQQVTRIFDQRIAATEAERQLFAAVEALCEPVWREHPDWTAGQCLDLLISQGNEQAAELKAAIS